MAYIPEEIITMIVEMVLDDLIPVLTQTFAYSPPPFISWVWPEHPIERLKNQVHIFRLTSPLIKHVADSFWFKRIDLYCGSNLDGAVQALLKYRGGGLECARTLSLQAKSEDVSEWFDPDNSEAMPPKYLYKLFSKLHSFGKLRELELVPCEEDVLWEDNFLFYRDIKKLLSEFHFPELDCLKVGDVADARVLWKKPNHILKENWKNLRRLAIEGRFSGTLGSMSANQMRKMETWIRSLRKLTELSLCEVASADKLRPESTDDKQIRIQSLLHDPSRLTRLDLLDVHINDSLSQFLKSTQENNGGSLRVMVFNCVTLNVEIDTWEDVFNEIRQHKKLKNFQVYERLCYSDTGVRYCHGSVLCTTYEGDRVALRRLVADKRKVGISEAWHPIRLFCEVEHIAGDEESEAEED